MSHLPPYLDSASRSKKLLLGASGLAAAITAAQSMAQSNPLIEEVYVTAQKKSVAEAVQDVPIAISAYSGRKIEAMFAVDLTDIGFTAPNVQLTPQGTVPGTANFSIRGWGNNRSIDSLVGPCGGCGSGWCCLWHYLWRGYGCV